jgi:hypothetical protein
MPADPHSGSKVWKAPDREIGKPGENRGKVIAHRNLQPSAAFHDRENRRNFRPGQVVLWKQESFVVWYPPVLREACGKFGCPGPVSNNTSRGQCFKLFL